MRNRLGAPFLTALVAYVVILHWAYQSKIAPVFYYMGSRYRDPNPVNYAFVVILVAAVGWLLPRTIAKASDFILWMLYVLVVVPASIVPQYADIITIDKSLILAVAVTGNFAMIVTLTSLDPIKELHIPRLKTAWAVIGGISVLVYVYLFVTTGLNLRFISLNDVYGVRFEYREELQTTGPLLGYLIRLQGSVLNPLIITRGLSKRSWPLFLVGAIGQLLIYSITGYKLILLSIPAIILMVFLFRKSSRPAGRLVLFGMTGATLAALASDAITHSLMMTTIFIYRLVLIPGTLTAAHVLVFDGQIKAQWAYSFMGPFIHNPYEVSPAFMVGAAFGGNSQNSANANFLGDGFANLGWIGMSIESLVVVLTLWFVNAASRHLKLSTVCMVFLIPTLGLANNSAFTSLLTNGFVFAIVLLSILPPQDEPDVTDETEPARPAAPT